MYSDDIHSPFKDAGMGEWRKQAIKDYFAHTMVLDVGSGLEGTARGLYKLFGDDPAAPRVINLNPQFTDWRRSNDNSVVHKYQDILASIQERMELSRHTEDFDGYMKKRIAIAGLTQHLPFADKTFDRIVSTYGFPNCLYDCGGDNTAHEAGYAEVLRTLAAGGEARLAPLSTGEQAHVVERLETQQNVGTYAFEFSQATSRGDVLVLSRFD
jgi:SAM-dependent methyltransferase